MMAQNLTSLDEVAERYLTDKVETVEEALSGARDIIAEWLNENEYIRRNIRWMFEKEPSYPQK